MKIIERIKDAIFRFYGCHDFCKISELTPATLESYLANLSPNTPSSPHNIALKVSSVEDFSTIRKALNGARNKYVNLDLSGSTVTSIEDDAFLQCESLTNVIIPDSVTSIGDGAFSNCKSLTSITISDSVTCIGALFLRMSLVWKMRSQTTCAINFT